jgi:hypothetical protein
VEIALILFVTTILMGILISVSSLLIAEKNVEHFSLGEIGILMVYAFIENFDLR